MSSIAPGPKPPRVSVLMTTYNGAPYIEQSIDSILGQTFGDLELIVVDDGSTDQTADIVARYRDQRLRLLRPERNLGVVGARNFGIQAARGLYVAACDHDDISHPARLKEQTAHLDAHPGVALVASCSITFDTDWRITANDCPLSADPLVTRWMLQLGNPLTYSSIMFRRALTEQLSPFMREEFVLADDFDLYHRVLRVSDIAVLPQIRTYYRQHGTNASRRREDEMHANASAILEGAYATLLGEAHEEAARLIATYIAGRRPIDTPQTVEQVRAVLERLKAAFVARFQPDATQRAAIEADIVTRHSDLIRRGVRSGQLPLSAAAGIKRRPGEGPIGWARATAGSLLGGSLARTPAHKTAKRLLQTRAVSQRPAKADGIDRDGPPTLHVVVDTEAEFDWSKPFARSDISVRSAAKQERIQSIFDRYNIRPVYVLDYPIASQAEGYEPLKAILARGGCAVGAHLQPWTTPPFVEEVSNRNSYPGNLPPELEAAKLEALRGKIADNLGVRPLFYKAGRYGLGPNTYATLAAQGFAVDFSVLPEVDKRLIDDGPDFRGLSSWPFVSPEGVRVVPMTRAYVGTLARRARPIVDALALPGIRSLGLERILSRTGLLNAIPLTPEGVSAKEQIRLVKALMKRGHRLFVMHYHSPSAEAGHTPYVTTEADLAHFLEQIEQLCGFFFGKLQGIPGNPIDLLPPDKRPPLTASTAG